MFNVDTFVNHETIQVRLSTIVTVIWSAICEANPMHKSHATNLLSSVRSELRMVELDIDCNGFYSFQLLFG